MSHAGVIQGSRVRILIYLLFAIQLVSMGAMEMSGPFWPVHLRGLTASESVSYTHLTLPTSDLV